ncbi:MAG: glycosyltransferase family 2 protein [Phyllobacterium sp.]
MASVDIAIPCYQHGHYLRDCVASVLQQGVDDIRILIIDNASTDNSAEVARALALEDSRIEVSLHQINVGPHASFNEGVDWADADYFMVLCSDDLLTPDSLHSMMDIMERNPDVSFAHGNDVHWLAGEARPDARASTNGWCIRDGRDFILDRCRAPERYIAAGMVLTRTSAHKKAGHYRQELPHTDDLEMLLRLATLGRVADCGSILGIKRMHAHNRTHDFLTERTRDLVERHAALESFFNHEGHDLTGWEHMLALGRRGISERAYWCGVKDLAHGRRSGIDLLKLAVRLSPRTAIIPPFSYLSRMERSLAESIRHG